MKENPIYIKQVNLLFKLHQLELKGMNETSQAEAIRDEMEDLWHQLNKKEQKTLNKMSEELYHEDKIQDRITDCTEWI